MYTLYLILLGLAVLSNCILIYILYHYGQRSFIIVSFIIFLLFINIWLLPQFLINLFHAEGMFFETCKRFSALGYVFTPAAFLTFTLFYTLRISIVQRISFWFILLIPAVIFLYLAWATNTISVHSFRSAILHEWGYETPIGKYFSIYLIWFEILVGSALFFLIRYYRISQEYLKKRQTFFVILAVLIPVSIGTVTNGILPFFNIYIFPAHALLSSIMATIVVYAIFKYGLFEITPRTILSSINHALITVDIKGNILQMNKFSEKMLGVKKTQVTGTSVDNILLIQDKLKKGDNQLRRILKQSLHKNKTITSDAYTIMDKKHHIVPSIISFAPVFSNHNVIGANILLRDITKEKSAEKHRDDFINMLAHELKTPVTSIKAYNQLLFRQLNPSDNKRQLVSKMDKQLDRLMRLVHDFFELSRVHTGKLKLKLEYIKIDDLIKEVIDTLSVTYGDRKMRIIGKTKEFVLADRDRITQVIINLVTNAIKYSPPDKEILVHLYSDAKKVTVGIQDFGHGVDPAFHKKIFNQFYQIDYGSSKNAGLGVGLFITSYIVKVHGGKIWVDSQVGHGSTFYFTLPVSR